MTVTYAHLTFLEYTASGTTITVSDYPHVAGEMPVCLVAWRSGNLTASLNSVVMSGNAFTVAAQSSAGGVTPAPRAAIFFLASAPGSMTTQVVLTFATNIQEAKVYILGVVGHGNTPFDSAGATEGTGAAATMGTVSAARVGPRTYTFAVACRQNTTAIVMTPAAPLSTIRFDPADVAGNVPAILVESPQLTVSGVTERVITWDLGGKFAMAAINIQGKLPIAPMLHHYIMRVGAR